MTRKETHEQFELKSRYLVIRKRVNRSAIGIACLLSFFVSRANASGQCEVGEMKLFACNTRGEERITICRRPNNAFSLVRHRPDSSQARYPDLHAEYSYHSTWAKGAETIMRFESQSAEITLFIKDDAYAVWPTHIVANGFDVKRSTCVSRTQQSPTIPVDGRIYSNATSRGVGVTNITTLGYDQLASPMSAPPDWPRDMD